MSQRSGVEGDGEAEAIRIFAEAFGSNADLYTYMRSLEVLKESMPEGAELVVGIDSGLYKLLKDPTPDK